jgi:hypothetical protein
MPPLHSSPIIIVKTYEYTSKKTEIRNWKTYLQSFVYCTFALPHRGANLIHVSSVLHDFSLFLDLTLTGNPRTMSMPEHSKFFLCFPSFSRSGKYSKVVLGRNVNLSNLFWVSSGAQILLLAPPPIRGHGRGGNVSLLGVLLPSQHKDEKGVLLPLGPN